MRIFFVVSYGDTATMEDTECSERLAFAMNTNTETFYYSGDSLKSVNWFYQFGGGQRERIYTNLKIETGFIKRHKVKGDWIIEALIGIVYEPKHDSTIHMVKFTETFKNCR